MPERVPTYLAAQVRAAEQPLLAAGEPLMARASAALVSIVQEEMRDAVSPRILVLAGSGDNGGDAMFAAAALASSASVDLLLVSDRFHAEGFAAATAAGGVRVTLAEALDEGHDLVVDGLVGIGSSDSAALRGTARDVVDALLPAVRAGLPVVAVDLPSGLHPDTGEADEAVLPAAVTVTFGAAKAGIARGRGPQLCGQVVLVDIGLGPGLEGQEPAGEALVERVVDARALSRPGSPEPGR